MVAFFVLKVPDSESTMLIYEGGPISSWPTNEKRKFWGGDDLFLNIVSFKVGPSPFRPIGQSLPSSEQVRLVKSTVSTVPWSLVRTSGSKFRRWSQNDAKTPWDCV